MKALSFLAIIFFASLSTAATVEDQAVDLMRSLIPNGKKAVYVGTLNGFSDSCEFSINYSDLTGVPGGYREVYSSLSAKNYQIFAKFDVSTLKSDSQKVSKPEFDARKFKIVRFYRENNNYSPWQQQVITVIKKPTGGVSAASIVMSYSINGSITGPYKVSRQVFCSF